VLGGRGQAPAGGRRLAVDFVQAGRAAELRQLEAFAERAVVEMPVAVADVFQRAGGPAARSAA
jgi:hypothetical protein